MWIFGYGSLVWKVDFPYVKKVIGYIEGYERRFWQASIDHRGVPEKPGRVVTLIPSSDSKNKVWGVAYKILRRDVSTVLEQLDIREVMGYEKVPVSFFPVPAHHLNVTDEATTADLSDDSGQGGHDYESSENEPELERANNEDWLISSDDLRIGRSFTVTMYYGSKENEHFIGPASLDSMANQIFECVGPSGTNKEYLYKLADFMRRISEDALDPHLQELELSVRALDEELNNRSPRSRVSIEL